MFNEDQVLDIDGLHVCPTCAKLFMEEKALYLHIMRVHTDGQQLAYDLEADLYRRWQNRLPRLEQ